MRRIIQLLFILIPALVLGNPNYYFQDVTENHMLSNIGIKTLCEDENGFLWFGGSNGLFYHNTLIVKKVQFGNTPDALTIKIEDIYKDHNNTLWFCTHNGLYKHSKVTNELNPVNIYYPEQKNNTQLIKSISQLNKNEYLLHIGDAIYCYNPNEQTAKRVNDIKNPTNKLIKGQNGISYLITTKSEVFELKDSLTHIKLLCHFPKHTITSVCKDGNKYYIGTSNRGLIVINSNGIKIESYNIQKSGNYYLKSNSISSIIKRPNGEIWIGTNVGIYIKNKGKLTLLDSKLETGLPHRTIYHMYVGTHHKIWVSTYSGKLACFAEDNYNFKHIILNYQQSEMDRSHVSTIAEDSRGCIWVGNEDEGGIKVYHPEKRAFFDEIPRSLSEQYRNVKIIIPIDNNTVVLGKNGSNTLSFYNYAKQNMQNEITLPFNVNPGVRGGLFDKGTLWINDPRKIVHYDIKENKVLSVYHSPLRIWQLYIDSSKNLWVCTSGGLYVLKPGTIHLEQLTISNQNSAISKTSIYSVCEDINGYIWVGTMGHGLYLYQPENGTIAPAPDHGLSSEADIYNILKDQQNNLWYITNKGLYRYDFSQKKTAYFGTNNGTLNAQNRLNASIMDRSGKLYFGSQNGFTIVDPSIIKKNKIEPRVFLADLKINNHSLLNDSTAYQNSAGAIPLKTLRLTAKENTLGFKVVSNNFIKAEKNRYRYRLLNYDDNWIEIAQNTDIVFTKIPPGKYIFEAYGSNNDKLWSQTPYRLAIKILPPVLLRWYAILAYILILIVIIGLVYQGIKTKIALRKAISEERIKTQTNELIHSERIKLFTNLSHELRTPLSLIASPISYLLHQKSHDDETQHLLSVAERNTQRLTKMADQTIDFRLLEFGKLHAHIAQHDIIQLVKSVSLCFEQEIMDREIDFSIQSKFKRINTLVDGDMIEKIIFNLLSNALKYSPEKSKIEIHIGQHTLSESDYNSGRYSGHKITGQVVYISIKDSGFGIKKELLPHIFKRFSKGDGAHQISSGIGLHLCQEYAAMNKGNLILQSEEGKGSTFSLNFPIEERTHFEKSKLDQMVKFDVKEKDLPLMQQNTDFHKPATILLVEDNVELRDFLKTFLSAYYKVITAKNAEQALTQLKDISPDLILTDVSMPGMGGLALIKRVKQHPDQQHIPFIVMTNYADRNYQMESIVSGASAFFTKPLDQAMLVAQINGILSQTEKSIATSKPTIAKDAEESFIQKAEKIVESHLQDPNFQIADLLEALNISKTTLTRRLKTTTGQNASGFIRDIRLNNARKLLANKNFNIDEIATFVGFSYTSYFIKSFKEKYGITPSEYRKLKK